MKYKGCTMYLTEDRNRDLLRAYKSIVRRSGFLPIKEIYNILTKEPSRRFWITGERAYDHIVNHRGYERRGEMYREIEKRARQYMKEKGCSFRKACRAVVLQPAPSFFLEARSINNIILRLLKREKQR